MPEAQCRASLCCNASPKTGSEFSGFLSVAELPTFLPPWREQALRTPHYLPQGWLTNIALVYEPKFGGMGELPGLTQ
jgi:hypothetical protein